jgi:hypothetical protein
MMKQQRLPRKIKKWVKRSAHYVKMQNKQPVITFDGWGFHILESGLDLEYIKKPNSNKYSPWARKNKPRKWNVKPRWIN